MAQTTPQPLGPGRVAYYPRVIRLLHSGTANNRLIASFDNGTTGAFYESTDDGATWQSISNIPPTYLAGNCCSGLFEVPQQMGTTPAGTLLWATSVLANATAGAASEIRIYKSTDVGRTWSLLATPITGTVGLWEAEFTVDSQGRLLMFFSSEEQKGQQYNQLLAHKVSTDGGLTWGASVIDVGIADNVARPGMAVVRRLPNGTYVMSYEVCGAQNCDAYIRTSADGANWGTPTNLGTRIESATGHHFTHAPTIAWANDGTTNGKLLAVGQELRNNSNNAVADLNGKVVMVNTNNGVGPWTEIAAPVEVPGAYNNPCPNYTSSLLPSVNGTQLLEVALDYVGTDCRAFYNTGSLTAAPNPAFTPATLPNGVYRIKSKNSGRVLDVDACSTADGARVQQYDWLGGDCQRWKLEGLGNGYYKITTQISGKALTIANCTTANLGAAQTTTWNNLDCQKWRIEQLGNGYYRLVSLNSGRVLDVDACSMANGGTVQQYDWLGGDCQRWSFELVSPNAITTPATYRITSKNSNKVLSISGCSTANLAAAQQTTWTGANCQQWMAEAQPDGFYRLVSVNSNRVLDVDACSTANGGKVQQYDWLGGDCQRWGFELVEPGYYRIISKNSQRVLDVTACSTADGALVQQYDWLNNNCQKWRMELASSPLATTKGSNVSAATLFPNPTAGQLFVKQTFAQSGTAQLLLFDALGRVQRRLTQPARAGENTFSLDVQGLAAGLYTLQLGQGSERQTYKVAVE
ncbi:MAG: RICIN domain-containing protein [Janthinobacterium lividum]